MSIRLRRRRRALAGAAAAVLIAGLLASCGSNDNDPATVVRVPGQASTIAAAVKAVAPGGLVLISPGTYHESVVVTKPGITIRGTKRNAVIIDGQDKRPVGISVSANGVRVQNLTVENSTLYGVLITGEPNGGTGRESTYGGKLDPSKNPPVQRFLVDHVTAVNNGLYGIYAFDSQHGVIRDSYASGSPDSGFYVGQCRHCDILVTGNLAERNAVGYEGANASDSVFIVGNRFSGNRVGLTLLSDYQEAFVPQHGAVVAGNVITDNTSADSPQQADGGFGIGVGISGGQGNTIHANRITGNPTAGVIMANSTDIPATGNEITGNVLAGNGVDVADVSTTATPSSGNCLTPRPGTTPTVLPTAIADAGCPHGAAEGPGVPQARLPQVHAPPGMPFTNVPHPKAQPNGTGDASVPEPLPRSISEPDLARIHVPRAGLLANLSSVGGTP